MKRLLTSGAIALALLTAPLAHAAAPARASAPATTEASELGGGGIPLSAIIVLITVFAGALYLAIEGDDDPDSP